MSSRPIAVTASAWFYIIAAAVSIALLAGCFIFLISGQIDYENMRGRGTGCVFVALPIALVLIPTAIVLQSAYIITGVGLLRRWKWARTTGIVLAPLTLLIFPLGIPVAPFVLILLLQETAREYFLEGR